MLTSITNTELLLQAANSLNCSAIFFKDEKFVDYRIAM